MQRPVSSFNNPWTWRYLSTKKKKELETQNNKLSAYSQEESLSKLIFRKIKVLRKPKWLVEEEFSGREIIVIKIIYLKKHDFYEHEWESSFPWVNLSFSGREKHLNCNCGSINL